MTVIARQRRRPLPSRLCRATFARGEAFVVGEVVCPAIRVGHDPPDFLLWATGGREAERLPYGGDGGFYGCALVRGGGVVTALFRHGFAVPPGGELSRRDKRDHPGVSPKGKAFCGCAALFACALPRGGRALGAFRSLRLRAGRNGMPDRGFGRHPHGSGGHRRS